MPTVHKRTTRSSRKSLDKEQTQPESVVYLCLSPMDMRKGFDTLASAVQTVLLHDTHSGHCFVFRNKADDRIKILRWAGNDTVLEAKPTPKCQRPPEHLPRETQAYDLANCDCPSCGQSLGIVGIGVRVKTKYGHWGQSEN